MSAPTVTSPPASNADWTVGNSSFGSVTIEPTSGKKTTGWTPAERPSPQFMNWLFYNQDQWIKYLNSLGVNHEYRIAANETSIGSLGTASSVSASNAGHVIATGTNVQAQLDELDLFAKDVENAISQGKGADLMGFVRAVDANWTSTLPNHVGDALDQLALRTKSLEQASGGQDFLQKTMNDYVLPADKPATGFPNGIGNPGLTSTLANNPRSLKISEMQTNWGEERLYIHSIKQTGNYDANGLEEWAVVAPKHDKRIMLYGNWNNTSMASTYEGLQNNQGQTVSTVDPASYILVTGVCDGIALMTNIRNLHSDQIQIEIDTVNTGSPVSTRGSFFLQNRHGQIDQILGNAGMTNIGYGLHTFKFQNGASDANLTFPVMGFILITTGVKELGGAMYLNKSLAQFTPGAVSAPTVGSKGGKIIRYVDPADSLRHDAVASVLEVNSSVSGSVGSGSTSLSLNSAAGWVSGAIAEVSDSPTNSELIYVNGVNTFTNTLNFPAPGLVNSYVNPTAKLYAKSEVATDHSNEKEKFTMNFQAFGSGQRDIQSSDSPEWISNIDNYNTFQGMTQDGVYCLSATSARVKTLLNPSVNGRYNECLNLFGNTNILHVDFRGTGLDILFDFGTAESSSFDVHLDGVKIPSIAFVTPILHPKWVKFCSDLPEGSHRISFQCTSSTCNQLGFIMAKIYEAAHPSALATIGRDGFLSKRTKLSDYLYNASPFVPSKGVIKQHLWQNTVFSNINPSVTSYGWSGSTYDANDGYNGALDWVECESGTAGDILQKWFYGTGVELTLPKTYSLGISEFKIDGNLATVANFPGVTFQGGSGGYNTSTGLFDAYDSATSNLYQKLSFSGLTEGWHQLQIRVTATKNVSATAATFILDGLYVIGGAFSDELFNNSTLMTSNITLGGCKDLRLMDSYNFENMETPVEITTTGTSVNYGGCAGYFFGVIGSIGCVETHGGDLEIALKVNAYTTAGNGLEAMIAVDGIFYDSSLDYISSTGYPIEAVARTKVPVLPGRHYIRSIIAATGGVLASEYTGVSIREITKRSAK